MEKRDTLSRFWVFEEKNHRKKKRTDAEEMKKWSLLSLSYKMIVLWKEKSYSTQRFITPSCDLFTQAQLEQASVLPSHDLFLVFCAGGPLLEHSGYPLLKSNTQWLFKESISVTRTTPSTSNSVLSRTNKALCLGTLSFQFHLGSSAICFSALREVKLT